MKGEGRKEVKMGIVCESVCCKPNRSLIHILEVAEVQNKKYFSLSWPLIRECFKMYWYIPVSYTHLDVYKRQVVCCMYGWRQAEFLFGVKFSKIWRYV